MSTWQLIPVHVFFLIYSFSVGKIVNVSQDVWNSAVWSCMQMSSRTLVRARCSWRQVHLCRINCSWLLWGSWSERNGRTVEMFGAGEVAEHHKFVARLFPDRRRRRDSERQGSLFSYDNLKLTFSAVTQEKRVITLPQSTSNCCLVLTKEKKKTSREDHAAQWCSVCPSSFYSPLPSPNHGWKDLWPGIFSWEKLRYQLKTGHHVTSLAPR